ncbi:hypothetical protein [Actinoplanes sp. NPDC020271]|uniref:hypothetical protein n=1 Tax=Actinoplanes sp. NPDC020271 TaxID=3363896 RepID=UPI00379204C1
MSEPVLSVTFLGLAGVPLRVLPIGGHPDQAVIYIGGSMHVSLHVSEDDVDRLTVALDQAREVLKGSASDQQGVE